MCQEHRQSSYMAHCGVFAERVDMHYEDQALKVMPVCYHTDVVQFFWSVFSIILLSGQKIQQQCHVFVYVRFCVVLHFICAFVLK